METKNFGKISFEPDSELEFPSGLPGFDRCRRFVAVRFVESDPLVYLHGVVEGYYMASWPVFVVGDDSGMLTFTVAVIYGLLRR